MLRRFFRSVWRSRNWRPDAGGGKAPRGAYRVSGAICLATSVPRWSFCTPMVGPCRSVWT